MKYCPKCRAEYEDWVSDCSDCKVSLVDEVSLKELLKVKVKEELNMYCRNCGKEVNEKAEVCVKCGVRPLAEKNYCQECGVETKPNQELCIKCGSMLKTLPKRSSNFFEGFTEAKGPIRTDFSELSQYYQEEFKKIYETNEGYRGKWNWAAFLFGVFWAFTKGLWFPAMIAIVGAFFSWGFIGIIYCFIFGVRGNYLYYCLYAKNQNLPA